MSDGRRIGRTIGILVLVQILVGVLVNFVLVGPVFQAPGGFAVGAAAHPLRISLAAVIGLAGGAISVGIAILLLAHLRRQGRSLALAQLALGLWLTARGFALRRAHL